MRLGSFSALAYGWIMFGAFHSTAQVHPDSPYTYFLIGDLHRNHLGNYRSLGGTAIASQDPISINPENPASYTSITRPFNQAFSFDITPSFGSFTDGSTTTPSLDIAFDNLNFWFRMGNKSAFNVGLAPYSRVSYHIADIDLATRSIGSGEPRLKGKGGLNKLFFGWSLDPIKRLSIGVNLAYYFGAIEVEQRGGNIGSGISGQVLQTDNLHLQSAGIDYGLQYAIPLGKKKLTLGGTFSPRLAFNGRLSTTVVSNGELLSDNEESEDDYFLPANYGFGLAFGKDLDWSLLVDYRYEAWAAQETNLDEDLQSVSSLSFGFRKFPIKTDGNILERTTYSAGFYTNNGYFEYDNQTLRQVGFTVGANFPISRSAMLSLTLDNSSRSPDQSEGITERYTKITIGLNVFDFWRPSKVF
ncbi:MAG: hypothetical protein KI790_05255 [Cyclobacteriaceae bacterium]|nr:hypothetical protein [Cyclobacteriaceae bacterium HetDA_MAG_MS6]